MYEFAAAAKNLQQQQQPPGQLKKDTSGYSYAQLMNVTSKNTILHSTTFQCFTSLSLYASLINELEKACRVVDACGGDTRQYVWNQIFILLGVPVRKCEISFSPIIQQWISSPTINLLAVEVLFVSLAVAVHRRPDLITEKYRGTPEVFVDCLRSVLPLMNSEQRGQKHARSEPERTLPNKKLADSSSNMALQLLEPEIIALKRWTPVVDKLPREEKEKLFMMLSLLPEFKSVRIRTIPLSLLLDSWVKDVNANKELIKGLYKSFSFLKESRVLDCEKLASEIYSQYNSKEKDFMNWDATLDVFLSENVQILETKHSGRGVFLVGDPKDTKLDIGSHVSVHLPIAYALSDTYLCPSLSSVTEHLKWCDRSIWFDLLDVSSSPVANETETTVANLAPNLSGRKCIHCFDDLQINLTPDFLRNNEFRNCPICCRQLFCSEECADMSYLLHIWECRALQYIEFAKDLDETTVANDSAGIHHDVETRVVLRLLAFLHATRNGTHTTIGMDQFRLNKKELSSDQILRSHESVIQSILQLGDLCLNADFEDPLLNILGLRSNREQLAQQKLFARRNERMSRKITLGLALMSGMRKTTLQKELQNEDSDFISKFLNPLASISFYLLSIMRTNALTIISDSLHILGLAVYVKGAYYNHSCRPNVQHYFDIIQKQSPKLNFRSLEAINSGEELKLSYIDSYQDTLKRRKILKESYCFECDCKRCSIYNYEVQTESNKLNMNKEPMGNVLCTHKICIGNNLVQLCATQQESPNRLYYECLSCGTKWDYNRVQIGMKSFETLIRKVTPLIENDKVDEALNCALSVLDMMKNTGIISDRNGDDDTVALVLAPCHEYVQWCNTLLTSATKTKFQICNSIYYGLEVLKNSVLAYSEFHFIRLRPMFALVHSMWCLNILVTLGKQCNRPDCPCKLDKTELRATIMEWAVKTRALAIHCRGSDHPTYLTMNKFLERVEREQGM